MLCWLHRLLEVSTHSLLYLHVSCIYQFHWSDLMCQDVRNVQMPAVPGQAAAPMDVFLSRECLAVVQRVFFYLFPRPLAPGTP
jgi:hypothetical protein